jgi:hypothetical protein
MTSIVLRKSTSRPDFYNLTIRTHDLGGTDYEPIVLLTEREALAVAGAHSGIDFFSNPPATTEPVAPAPITIERVPDRQPGTRAWRFRIGETLVTREKEGEIIPIRLSDDHVQALERHASVLFEPGQPDWDLREIENMEDRAIRFREDAEKAEAAAAAARRSWLATREAPREDPAPGL